jgi:ubiquinone/menaquinone biosynthesis C-methylase UbiE
MGYVTQKDRSQLYRLLTDPSSARDQKIIHLHGHFDDPDSVILDTSDYQELLGDEFLGALRSTLGFTKNLVFVGFGKGLDDPHFEQFLEWTWRVTEHGNRNIFRLCREQDLAALRASGIGVPVAYGREYVQLPGFLSRLLPDGEADDDDVVPPPTPPYMPKCVPLLAKYGSKTLRERAIKVLEEHIKPACRDAKFYVPERIDDRDLFDASMSSLLNAPMAIAYLGKRSAQCDVLARIGFRLATGKPLVLVFEKGEEFQGLAFESLQNQMKMREMKGIVVSEQDGVDPEATRRINTQIKEELERQHGKYFGPTSFLPTAIVQVDTNRNHQEYIDATDSAIPLLASDKYLLGRRGDDIVQSLKGRIAPEQWRYFEREQDRLYNLFLSDEGVRAGTKSPIARIPLIYERPEAGAPKAILPIVTRHASRGGVHNLEVLHLDVSDSVVRMADGHYELVSPRGVEEVTCAALADDRWFYSPSPGIHIGTDGTVTDTNLCCRVLLEATDGALHGQPLAALVGRFTLDGDEPTAAAFRETFQLEGVKSQVHSLEFQSPAFGRVRCRGVAIPLIDLVSGHPAALSWSWVIKEVEREGQFRAAMRDYLTSALKWDVYAANYDRVLPQLPYYSDTVKRHIEHLADDEIRAVCDIGAGTGNVTLELLERGCQVTAVDLSRAMLRHLRAKTTIGYLPQLTVLEQSAEHLGQLAGGSFDAVTSMLALYGMQEPKAALDECLRILRPGGKIVLTEPNPGLSVDVIIDQANEFLKQHQLLDKLADAWRLVQEAGHWLQEEIRMNIDEIEAALRENRFEIGGRTASHYGQCTTLVATKPR